MPALSSLVDEFIEARTADGLSQHTIKHYRISLSHFVGFVGGETSPDDVTKRTVRSFIADRRERGEAMSTLSSRHAALSAFWSWLVDEDEASDNVVKRIPRPKEKIRPVPLVTEDQMNALLKQESRTPFLTVRNRAMLMILWDCGVRVGELCSLTLEDIDFERKMLTVRGKTGERSIPFGRATGVALRRYLRRRPTHTHAGLSSTFVGNHGAVSEAAVALMLKHYGKQAGFHLHPHMFRHSWVDSLLSAGATILDVQVLGGWSSPTQIMNRYGIAGKQSRAIAAHRRLSPGDRLTK